MQIAVMTIVFRLLMQPTERLIPQALGFTN